MHFLGEYCTIDHFHWSWSILWLSAMESLDQYDKFVMVFIHENSNYLIVLTYKLPLIRFLFSFEYWEVLCLFYLWFFKIKKWINCKVYLNFYDHISQNLCYLFRWWQHLSRCGISLVEKLRVHNINNNDHLLCKRHPKRFRYNILNNSFQALKFWNQNENELLIEWNFWSVAVCIKRILMLIENLKQSIYFV